MPAPLFRAELPAKVQDTGSLQQLNQTIVADHVAEFRDVTKGGSLPCVGSATETIHIPSALSAACARGVPGWKAPLDLMLVLLALPLWLPLLLLLMLVTRIASRGPVFYRQKRVGLGGKHFFIWKLRTMKVSAETQCHERYFEELMRTDCVMTKLDTRGDPRLAPFGRILRASGLDELPQIFNVLSGEMSLVGPRPCIPYEIEHFQPYQLERFDVPQGLTGLWQVTARANATFGEALDMDVAYARGWSLGLDLRLLLRTPFQLLRQWNSTT
jgi:lipopolysaccharide/colanic/teichoic acid biosynthesis glycosyltransferase